MSRTAWAHRGMSVHRDADDGIAHHVTRCGVGARGVLVGVVAGDAGFGDGVVGIDGSEVALAAANSAAALSVNPMEAEAFRFTAFFPVGPRSWAVRGRAVNGRGLCTAARPVDAFDMEGGPPHEVSGDRAGIRERADREAEAVAVEADGAGSSTRSAAGRRSGVIRHDPFPALDPGHLIPGGASPARFACYGAWWAPPK